LVLPGSRARIVRCGGRYDPQLVKRSSEWVSECSTTHSHVYRLHSVVCLFNASALNPSRQLDDLDEPPKWKVVIEYLCVLCRSLIIVLSVYLCCSHLLCVAYILQRCNHRWTARLCPSSNRFKQVTNNMSYDPFCYNALLYFYILL